MMTNQGPDLHCRFSHYINTLLLIIVIAAGTGCKDEPKNRLQRIKAAFTGVAIGYAVHK